MITCEGCPQITRCTRHGACMQIPDLQQMPQSHRIVAQGRESSAQKGRIQQPRRRQNRPRTSG